MDAYRGRRRWPLARKRRIVAEARDPETSVSAVARRHGVNANLLFKWLRDPRLSEAAPAEFLPVTVAPAVSDVAEASTGTGGGAMEIALPNGAVVRCGADVDAGALLRVLDVLGRVR